MKNFLIGTFAMCSITVLIVFLRAILFLPGRLELDNARASPEAAKQAKYSRCAQRPAGTPCPTQDGPRS